LNNILITGACGYVGKALVPKLKHTNLVSIDRFYDDKIHHQSNRFFCDDLNGLSSDAESFLESFSGKIIHLAAARTDDSIQETYEKDNVKATQALIKNLNPKKINLFIHVGSVAAIDGKFLDQNRANITSPDDWYRVSKYQQQLHIESWAKSNNVPLVILAPSAIYDNDAKKNSTNIGRLEKAVSLFKVVPEINILKSLTSMSNFIKAIVCLVNRKTENTSDIDTDLVNRYLIIDKPIMTVTEICKNKFKARLVIRIPKLKTLLLIISGFISLMGLCKIIPLSKERIIKLYKPTDYKDEIGYKEWLDEEA